MSAVHAACPLPTWLLFFTHFSPQIFQTVPRSSKYALSWGMPSMWSNHFSRMETLSALCHDQSKADLGKNVCCQTQQCHNSMLGYLTQSILVRTTVAYHQSALLLYQILFCAYLPFHKTHQWCCTTADCRLFWGYVTHCFRMNSQKSTGCAVPQR